ncbi:uncharacterized protein B0H18DRAFT_1010355 [Fomitopsis serialis]|uniref:uncharacterized protein n=1 Tax=Fomitopsis serialis TaxID=139415 RepID=UPI002007A21F|nr:uncharacterized protein B0H18DRAFT_1010355 [Neoantrodia serialis]KAH9924839.1 hypothetical protein B0H18DRAFT_1010355 [Neoantrodia serialis]
MLGLVIANVVEMLPLTTNAVPSCQAVGIFYDILQLMTFLEWAALVSSRACAMAADMIVVLVTWLYTRGPELMPQVLAFRALLLISLAQIIMIMSRCLSIGTVFLIPMMSVLVSRFLLNIREAADSTYRMRASDFNATLEGTDSSELSFALQEVNTNTTTDSEQLTSDLARTYDHMEGSSTAVGSVV